MRDTNKDWNEIAKIAPYWGVLSHDEFKQPDADALDTFFKTGRDDISYTEHIFKKIFGEFAPKSALDFGCGTGRLLVAMQKRVGDVVGVDIADEMRRICTENMCSAGAINFKVLSEIPEAETFDWVNSIIVLQHIPARRGYELIKKLWNATNDNGYFSIQFPIYHDRSHVQGLEDKATYFVHDGEGVKMNLDLSSPETGTMMMFDYDFGAVMSLLNLQDRAAIYLEHTNHGGHHGVWLFVRKPAA